MSSVIVIVREEPDLVWLEVAWHERLQWWRDEFILLCRRSFLFRILFVAKDLFLSNIFYQMQPNNSLLIVVLALLLVPSPTVGQDLCALTSIDAGKIYAIEE